MGLGSMKIQECVHSNISVTRLVYYCRDIF